LAIIIIAIQDSRESLEYRNLVRLLPVQTSMGAQYFPGLWLNKLPRLMEVAYHQAEDGRSNTVEARASGILCDEAYGVVCD